MTVRKRSAATGPLASALLALLVVVTLVIGPTAQTAQQPTFRTRIDAVSVDAVVTDKAGNPVTDLAASDFEITEHGKVQRIESFKLVTLDDGQEADPSSVREIRSHQDQELETARNDVRLIVIFLDDYHVRRLNSVATRDRIAAFVRQISPRDLVAIMYPLTPVVTLTFSRNRDEQARSIEKFVGRKYNYFPENPIEQSYTLASSQAQEGIRDSVTTFALKSLCIYLGSLREGRKTVLFVSEGVGVVLPPSMNQPGAPIPLPQLRDDGRRISDVANESNTSIYPLDPRGLTSSEFDMGDGNGRIDAAFDRRTIMATQEFLRSLAYATDGRAMVNQNEFGGGLKQMLRDTSAYYLLGYTSTEAPRDGQFHEIAVKVKRRDVEVRARRGYWALSATSVARATTPPSTGPPAAITAALSALVQQPSLWAVRTLVTTAKGHAARTDVTLVWEAVSGSASSASPTVEKVMVTAASPDGDTYFRGAADRDPLAGQPGGRVTFEAPPGAAKLRVTALSADGHVLDTEARNIMVPDFTGVGPAISTPLVFRARTARDVHEIELAATPLPTTSREFLRSERLVVRFHAYGPGVATPRVTLRLLDERGHPITALPTPVAAVDGGLEIEVGLAPFAAGTYLLEIGAAADTGQAQTLVAFRIKS